MNSKSVIFGIIIYCLFSLSSVFMKFASLEDNIFIKLVFFCISIGILGFFSILWQKMLNKFDLNKAYYFKATTIMWGLIYGIIFFKEKVTLTMILGSIICIVGVVVILKEKNND